MPGWQAGGIVPSRGSHAEPADPATLCCLDAGGTAGKPGTATTGPSAGAATTDPAAGAATTDPAAGCWHSR
jgi:hypothetical protein